MVLLVPFLFLGAILLFAVPIALYYGWAASILWGWFVVPVFGLPPVSTLQMWGICLFLGMLRPRFQPEKSKTDGWENGISVLIFAPLISLGIGYVLRFWWMA